ncbi:MAG: hypothetical protein CMJ48_00260 [Planctomycetaceae bacterium]|nr:hypothetical protein [Planctomycetaceae bacterium]
MLKIASFRLVARVLRLALSQVQIFSEQLIRIRGEVFEEKFLLLIRLPPLVVMHQSSSRNPKFTIYCLVCRPGLFPSLSPLLICAFRSASDAGIKVAIARNTVPQYEFYIRPHSLIRDTAPPLLAVLRYIQAETFTHVHRVPWGFGSYDR